MSKDTQGGLREQHPASAPPPAPHYVRLPGFVADRDVGLGDVIKHATSAVGIQPCGDCAERARRLNQWLVFTPKRRG